MTIKILLRTPGENIELYRVGNIEDVIRGDKRLFRNYAGEDVTWDQWMIDYLKYNPDATLLIQSK